MHELSDWGPLLVATTVCIVLLVSLARVAKSIGLVDIPNDRKLHGQPIPLVGGIAVCTALVAGLLVSTIPLSEYRVLFLCMLAITILGVLDDYRELDARSKFWMQLATAFVLVYFGDTVIRSVGEVFFYAKPYGLGIFAIPFSVFAIVGTVNAINMSDGHDGLAGLYLVVGIVALLILSNYHGQRDIRILLLVLVSVLPFLVFNFAEFVGREKQIFLGDAGSTALGLILVYFLIDLSKPENSVLKVAAAPWIIGMPLLDMMAVLCFRLRKRASPLIADRLHVHHLLLELGVSKYGVLAILGITQVVFVGVGVVGTIWQWNDGILIWSCFILLAVYVWIASVARAAIAKRTIVSNLN